MRHALTALACPLLVCFFLAACNSKPPQEIRYDHVADDLHLPRPMLDLAPPTSADESLPAVARQRLIWQRMFFNREFATLDAELLASHQTYAAGESSVSGLRTLSSSLEETQMAGLDVCRDWLAQMPASYSAHVICGSLWQATAWKTRGGEYSNKVPAIHFKLMDERFAQADVLFERAIPLDPKPVEALSRRATTQFMQGEHESAETLRAQALRLSPKDPNIHLSRIRFALPEWGGSDEEAQAAYADAQAAGVEASALADLHDVIAGRSVSTNQSGIAYLQKALTGQHTQTRLERLVRLQQNVKNHEAAIQIATQLIEEYPDSPVGYSRRAESERALGKQEQALEDFKMAAALGYDYAMWVAIDAYKQGRLGVPAHSWSDMLVLCEKGARLGLPSAASCMAKTLDGNPEYGGLVPVNMPQALAWHQFSARGGHRASQYHLGSYILSGKVAGLTHEQAQTNGVFWLRRAAKQDVPLASQKLKELGLPEEEEVAAEDRRSSILAALFRAFLGI